MGGQTLTKIFKQKRARGEKLEKLKNSSPSQPVVKRAMTRRSQVINVEQPQAKGTIGYFELIKFMKPEIKIKTKAIFGGIR